MTMELRYTAGAARLSRRGARLDGGQRAARAARDAGVGSGLRGASRVGAHARARALGHGDLAGGVRRARLRPDRVADLRGGVLPGAAPAARQPERHLPARADADGVRHARAEGALPAADGGGRGDLGAGLVRAAGGLGHGGDCAPLRCATATTTCCAVRRSGPRARRSPTGASACSAPTRRRSATAASRSSCCRSTCRVCACAASRRSTARPASPRSSSTTRACRLRTGSAPRAQAGRSRWRPPASSAG